MSLAALLEAIPIDRALSVLGLLTGLYFYLRSRSIKRLDVTHKVTWLQSKRHPDIRIYFREHEVANLSRVRILFSNSGSLPLRPAHDFPSKFGEGLRLAATDPETKILSAAMLGGDIETAGASIANAPDGSNAVLRFEYLNPGQRIAVEALFTGPMPSIQVEIVGGEKRIKALDQWKEFTAGGDLEFYVAMFAGIATMFLPRAMGWLQPEDVSGWMILAAVVVGLGTGIAVHRWRRHRKRNSGRALLED